MTVTFKEASVLAHTLGVNLLHAKESKKAADKRLPKSFYRNRFCASEGHDDLEHLVSLSEKGLMEKGGTINQGTATLWYVTSSGEGWLRDNFDDLVKNENTSKNARSKKRS
jgi:hypothetical protein